MNRFFMELSDLRIFKAVVETGGISRAAEMLNRVPSNITARIQKLESELGKNLFIREKNRLRVSPAGEQLFIYAKKILLLANEALEQLNHEHPKGKFRLGSMEAVAASRLSSVLMGYHKNFPEVSLEVSTGPTGKLIEQVLSGDLDLALVADPPKDKRLDTTPIFIETLVLVSDLSLQSVNHPDDLGQNPTLLGFSSQCAYRARLESWIKENDAIANVIEISSYNALLNCITAGMGIGLVPEILLDFYPFKDGLKVHALPTHLQKTTTYSIWRKDSVKPSLRAFNEALMKFSNLP
jgi:DNA-binding transcriptional LysR family regulator